MNIIIKLMGVKFYEMSIGQIHERKEMSGYALYVDKINEHMNREFPAVQWGLMKRHWEDNYSSINYKI
jgi:hypothetical protein